MMKDINYIVRLKRLCIVLCILIAAITRTNAYAEIIPMQAWVHDPLIDSIQVNPGGTKLTGLTLTDINKPPQITVWNLNNLNEAPIRFAPKDSKALFVNWLNDDTLLVLGRQKFDVRAGGRFTKTFQNKIYLVDSKGKRFREILGSLEKRGAGLENRMPKDKSKVLISVTTMEFADDLYELDLRNFSAKRVYRGSPKKQASTNAFGQVAVMQQLKKDSEGAYIEFSYKNPDSGKWEPHHQKYAKGRDSRDPVGFSIDGRSVYVVDDIGRDKTVLRKYDIATRKLSEPLFGGDNFSATGILTNDHPDKLGELVGYVGMGAKQEIKYVDADSKARQTMIDNALPKGNRNRITSFSDDYSKIVVASSGVTEAGAYYLMLNQKEILPLGRAYPELDPAKMSQMEYVEYPARDGFTIPAYLTKPKFGKAPYPTIIMPHGGPWARDFYGWDRWVQFLTNRGYAVLQPQYRGSDGWGKALWLAGDNKWGELMQDDKDDGAAWLVKTGVASKDRIAMYGYSYGGYAAMAAVVRPNSPYQCAISGAGLSELRTFDKLTFSNAFQREFQNATIDGLSPYDNVKDANIPIYIFHGDRDQRVPVDQSRKYYKALKKAGKDVEYNEIPDLWHSNPWMPTHHVNMLTNLEDYLANRCGPGGL